MSSKAATTTPVQLSVSASASLEGANRQGLVVGHNHVDVATARRVIFVVARRNHHRGQVHVTETLRLLDPLHMVRRSRVEERRMRRSWHHGERLEAGTTL